MPDISIVTPSYQQLPWLRLCAASVADQAGVSFEHIIQDAGSGPEFHKWATSWIAVHPTARIHEEKDNGMYDAINRGFRRAFGGVLAWLNCDEQYLPGTLEKVCAFFRANPGVDVLFGDAILVSETGALLSYRRTILPELDHIRLSHLNTLSCATFVRRSVVERGFLLDDSWKTIADGVWVAEMLKAGIKMAVLPEPLSVFTILKNNLGQTDIAREEQARWRSAETQSAAWQRPLIILRHRIRKMLAGAYQSRKIAVELYTQDSPNSRKRMTSDALSFSWVRHKGNAQG